ncbi:methyltransferase domain-containing protein [Shimia sp. FJ5]|uniref:methyltransferase domain-containing protein n=1 Tax=Shimia sp. FJ5 TaxID=3079054 RepID=UPI00262AD201|nr:methyltransferase domain-containing protein [Shimia sp. FJ5]MDV4145762.1 methyltransferase domain-containing protein [Shimia sp. FJ5]
MRDWRPDSYGRFADVRLQPALDLLARVGEVPGGDIVDLGCGSGVMGAALAMQYPGRRLVGVDRSPKMLGKALETEGFSELLEADIAAWEPDTAPALVFSNAALQWLDGHEALLPRLAQCLVPGGVLAVQMPHQTHAPSHRGWGEAFAALFGDREIGKRSEVLDPAAYFDLLSPLGALHIWETEYYQNLPAAADGHPVRLFSESTYGRPYLEAAGDTEDQARLIEAYEAAMAKAYPLRADGTVLFPFRRLFFVLQRALS